MPDEIKGNDQATPAPNVPAPGKTGDVAEGTKSESVKPAPAVAKPAAEAAATPAAPAAAKPAPPAAAAPAKPAAPKPPAGPTPQPWDSEMVSALKRQFGSGIKEAATYVGQKYLVVDKAILGNVLQLMRRDEQFDYCVDITAVHYPKREGAEFEVIYILYSFPRNETVRVKASVGDGEQVPSAVPIWPTANWLEREVFDMFGIRFAGHPDLRRILLPEDWTGYPLRKDYSILQQDNEWVKIHLGIESGQ